MIVLIEISSEYYGLCFFQEGMVISMTIQQEDFYGTLNCTKLEQEPVKLGGLSLLGQSTRSTDSELLSSHRQDNQ